MSKIESYTTHNFDAVNDHIKQISKRESARTFAYRLKSFSRIFIYIAAAALIFAFVLLVIGWFYRILYAPFKEKEIEIVRPEVVEKQVVQVVEVPVLTQTSEITDSSMSYRGPKFNDDSSDPFSSIENNNQIPQEPAKVVKTYTQFQTVTRDDMIATNIDSQIITGYEYSSSETDFPEIQFCYTYVRETGDRYGKRVDLMRKKGNSAVDNLVTTEMAQELNVSRAALRRAASSCQIK
tara:strand:- start:720 stop:1430 length:711 start_codon:yes stop_codon:yes gene_type:complete